MRKRAGKAKIRVVIIGVGNCASTFLQGLAYHSRQGTFRSKHPGSEGLGLWHEEVSAYKVADIEVVEAIDVDRRKVGLDLSHAISAEPNVSQKFLEVPPSKVTVKEGIMEDSPPQHLKDYLIGRSRNIEDISEILKKRRVDVAVNLISSGMDRSSRAYAQAALRAGASFVNATPSPIAVDERMERRFREAGLVVVGDDIMSQLGGTAFHKGIVDLMEKRGIRLVRSYQIDVGGGAETLNTTNEEIKAMKAKLKTSSIVSEAEKGFEAVAGTTDYVDYMGNERTSYFWIEGKVFLGSDVRIDIYLRTADGPNAGNILLDVIRATHAVKLRGMAGAPEEICAMGFKKPPTFMKLHDSYAAFAKKYLVASV